MRPHEEEWEIHSHDARCVVRASDGLVVADVREPLNAAGREAAMLVAAAPRMARALLRLGMGQCSNTGSRHHSCADAGLKDNCGVCEARAALTKAGVL